MSTDSEGINNSPPYLSPIQHHQQQLSNVTYTSAAASLVAVLSDEPPPSSVSQSLQIPNDNEIAETATIDVELPIAAKLKPKSRKQKANPDQVKIKSNSKSENNNENKQTAITVTPVKRSSRQQRAAALAAASTTEVLTPNIPEIGTANYELYRTLTADEHQNTAVDANIVPAEALTQPTVEPSTTHSDAPQKLDETPVNATSVAPKKRGARTKTATKPPNNTQVPASGDDEPITKKLRGRRNPVVEAISPVEEIGRRRITAAAKKHYKDSVETIPEVIAPQIPEQPIEVPTPAIEVVNESPPPKTRGRKAVKKAIEVPTEPVALAPSTRSVRATRHNTNGNMMQVSACGHDSL